MIFKNVLNEKDDRYESAYEVLKDSVEFLFKGTNWKVLSLGNDGNNVEILLNTAFNKYGMLYVRITIGSSISYKFKGSAIDEQGLFLFKDAIENLHRVNSKDIKSIANAIKRAKDVHGAVYKLKEII